MLEVPFDPDKTLPETITMLPGVRPFLVKSYGLTDRGKVRPANEDCFLIAELARTLRVHHTNVPAPATQYSKHRGHMFVVSDGMGGHQAGEVASSLSVSTLESYVLNSLKRLFHLRVEEEPKVLKDFRNAILEADARIIEEAAEHPALHGMGATLTLAFAVDWKLFVAHVGDSRCYLFSEGELQQITRDHTVAAEMMRRGMLSPEKAATSRYRHVVTNALGGHTQGADVELHNLSLQPGDMILLCSDGLTDMIGEERLGIILRAEPGLPQLCTRLIDEANEAGGKDNITVLAARFETA